MSRAIMRAWRIVRFGKGWTIPAGRYRFAIGDNAEALGQEVEVTLRERRWKD